MEQNPISTKVLRVVFFFGMILFFVIFLNKTFSFTIFNLPRPTQSIYALASAMLYFFASYISNRKDFKKTDRFTGLILFSPWFGVIAIGVAVFLALVDFETRAARLGILINYFLGGISFLNTYLVVIFYWFPQIIVTKEEQVSPSDSLNRLPKNLQEIVSEGRQSVDKTTISVAAVCISVVVISGFYLSGAESPLTIFVIEIIAVIIIAFIARYYAIRKWQKRAMQSGIPEKKLKSAAKLAGLPWLKIKEE